MEKEKVKEFLVESPPRPPRKVRRKRPTKRERGVEAALRNGQFVMPLKAFNNTPIVIGICELSLQIYNQTADLKILKKTLEAQMEGTEGAACLSFERICNKVNSRISRLRSVGYMQREYILEVEGGMPVNEPLIWERV